MLTETAEILMKNAPAFVYIFVFLYGIVFGSFLNVCIYRLPKGESIVKANSHCMTCGKRLHWYELVPIFSWLFLRGKCHGCRSKISVQYPLIEAANGLLFVLCLAVKGLSVDMVLCQALMSALLVLSVIDARTKEIPNGINIFIAVIGLIRAVINIVPVIKTHGNVLDIVLGPVVVSGVLMLILIISGGGAIGGGDVKLMAAAGLFLGLKGTVLALVIGCIAGSVIHVSLMKLRHLGRQLAMGPYLSLGIAVSALWGSEITAWYLHLLTGA
jgi:leader peptidase (prepilin peptidase)/N-methyltransferase